VIRICIVGPESSGKTTLARQLAEHLGVPWVREFVREYFDRPEHDGVGSVDDIVPVVQGQIAAEDQALAESPGLLICDTNPLSTVVWSEVLYGECPEVARRLAEERASDYDLYLLLRPDLPWQADGQRCQPELAERQAFFARFEEYLRQLKMNPIVISGLGVERFAQTLNAVSDFLRARGADLA